ncbi:ribbon-helix-helix domain-containing protein [Sulfurovum sp.]|uniref:ribbon-helix-helix domain-containing protein n=1 Tax=Sulfurovum sp. TaxID=1969726 RepID=UPI0025E403F1|nr:ribbon-helix-helix domain-containing protein [Sulfurovum sp.]
MHSVSQLEKQQVGLRLPKYLIEEIDAFTEEFSVNRTDIITEAVKSYIEEQKEKMFYESFEQSAKELKAILDGKKDASELATLDELIDELENS